MPSLTGESARKVGPEELTQTPRAKHTEQRERYCQQPGSALQQPSPLAAHPAPRAPEASKGSYLVSVPLNKLLCSLIQGSETFSVL